MITQPPQPVRVPTRQRLLREGLRLFARQGFAGTSVGDIEVAAGLKPRRGALYRHFQSKEALLEEAVTQLSPMVQQGEMAFTDIPPGVAPGDFGLLVGRWILTNLDTSRDMTHIIERDGDMLPAARAELLAGSNAGFHTASNALRVWADAAGLEIDTDAFAVVLVGALVNFRRSTWTLGSTPIGLDDERIIQSFATLFAMLVDTTKRTPPDGVT
jgi:AcrR family transcriptional regulator